MDITAIVVIITFFVALIEKFSKKPISDRKGIWRKLKLENVALLFLGLALVFQIIDAVDQSRKEKKMETKTDETFEKVLSTQERVEESNRLINNILNNIQEELQYTEKEFELIESLNKDIANVADGIRNNLREYQRINSQYKKQLDLERQKIKIAQPFLRIKSPRSIIDSVYFAYQFQFINLGKRPADSLTYSALMIYSDKNGKISGSGLFKTNEKVLNYPSVTQDQLETYFVNSPKLPLNKAKTHDFSFLIVKYKYYDFMTQSKTISKLEVFYCPSLVEDDGQYGRNVDSESVELMKIYLKENHMEYYNVFWE